MAERKKRTLVLCKRCSGEFMAKRIDAKYCPECRLDVKREAGRKSQARIRNWEKTQGDIKIDPYYLTRGDIIKHMKTGLTPFSGAA